MHGLANGLTNLKLLPLALKIYVFESLSNQMIPRPAERTYDMCDVRSAFLRTGSTHVAYIRLWLFNWQTIG